MKLTPTLLAAAMLAAISFQAEAKKVQLGYLLKPGDEFTYTTAVAQDIAQDVMGQTNTMTMETTMSYHFKVIESNADGSFRLSGMLVELIMDSKTPMGDVTYNSSTDKEVPDYAKMSTLTLNETYLFTLSRGGAVTDVVAPEGMEEKISKAMAEMENLASQLVQTSANIGATPEGFAKSVGGFFYFNFPESPVKPKFKWSTQEKVEQMVVFNTAIEYTFLGNKQGTNDIKVVTQITQADPSAGMQLQGMNMTYELAGGKEGTYSLDPVTGLISKGEGVTTISGVISVESSELPAPMTIPMSIKSTEKISRK